MGCNPKKQYTGAENKVTLLKEDELQIAQYRVDMIV